MTDEDREALAFVAAMALGIAIAACIVIAYVVRTGDQMNGWFIAAISLLAPFGVALFTGLGPPTRTYYSQPITLMSEGDCQAWVRDHPECSFCGGPINPNGQFVVSNSSVSGVSAMHLPSCSAANAKNAATSEGGGV